MSKPLFGLCTFKEYFCAATGSLTERILFASLNVIWMNNCEASLCILMTCISTSYKIEMEIGWRVYLIIG